MNVFTRVFGTQPTKLLLEVIVEESRIMNLANKEGLKLKKEILDIATCAINDVKDLEKQEVSETLTAEMKENKIAEILSIAKEEIVKRDEIYADETIMSDIWEIAHGTYISGKELVERTDDRDEKLKLKMQDANFLRNGDFILNRFFNILKPCGKYDTAITTELEHLRAGKTTPEASMDKYGRHINKYVNEIYNIIVRFSPYESAVAEVKASIGLNKAQRAEFVKALEKTDDEKLKATLKEEIGNIDVNLALMEGLNENQLLMLAKEVHRENVGQTSAKLIDYFNKLLLLTIPELIAKHKQGDAVIPKEHMVVIHTITAMFVSEALLLLTKTSVGCIGPNLANNFLFTILTNKYLSTKLIGGLRNKDAVGVATNDAEVVKEAVDNLEETTAKLMGVDKEVPHAPLPKCVGDAQGLEPQVGRGASEPMVLVETTEVTEGVYTGTLSTED